MGSGHDHHLPQENLQIKEESKFFSRLLSKESSMANSSYRVLYYGGASGAVPFMWEIQPGTPKHTLSDTSLIPPLTPPPSHHSNSNNSQKSMQRLSKPSFLFAIFPRLALRKALVSPPPPPPSSSSSSSSWSSVSSSNRSQSTSVLKSNFHGHCCFLGGRKPPLQSRVDDDDYVCHSPNSTLQFGVRSEAAARSFRGCYSVANIKNALLSIAGHGSNQGTA